MSKESDQEGNILTPEYLEENAFQSQWNIKKWMNAFPKPAQQEDFSSAEAFRACIVPVSIQGL